LDSKALTKIQSVALIAIIVAAAVAGSVGYILWRGTNQNTETIKIGVCADLDNVAGKPTLQGAILAAEQVNAKGGVLGRNLTIVAEDDDSETTGGDITIGTNTLTKLITVDNAEFVVTPEVINTITYQSIAASHKTILFSIKSSLDQLTQRVADNYDQYKYFFRVFPGNNTQSAEALTNSMINLRSITGFNKVAFLATDATPIRAAATLLNTTLTTNGFDIVYQRFVIPSETDYTSYLSAIDASGAQILFPFIVTQTTPALVKEWHDRQSPYIICGSLGRASESSFWNLTEGKCESLSCTGVSATVGFPLTNVTVQTRQAYIQRWGSNPTNDAVAAYDVVRFILPDAIKRAGTTETNAVIKTLETTQVETSNASHMSFTSWHDPVITFLDPNAESRTGLEHSIGGITFQWQQGGVQVPIGPKAIRIEADATYVYPSWSGPWDNRTK
jgi:branched-chain amino acid transport system substrate-binding protein